MKDSGKTAKSSKCERSSDDKASYIISSATLTLRLGVCAPNNANKVFCTSANLRNTSLGVHPTGSFNSEATTRKAKGTYSNFSAILSNAPRVAFSSYPEILNTVEIDALVEPEYLVEHQKNWIDFYSKFDNPIEKEFFKPYWIPLQTNSYDFFIDMSDKNYPLFETRYFFYEPYQWYKKYIVKNIYELLLSSDDDKINIETIMELNDKERWNLVMELFNKN